MRGPWWVLWECVFLFGVLSGYAGSVGIAAKFSKIPKAMDSILGAGILSRRYGESSVDREIDGRFPFARDNMAESQPIEARNILRLRHRMVPKGR